MHMELETGTDLFNAKVPTGEKFTDDEVVRSGGLQMVAEAYVQSYRGDFAYMVDLKSKLRKGLSIGQLRGALNVALAETRRTQAPKREEAVLDLTKLVAFFDAVSGIKAPKIRLQVDGEDIIVVRKTERSKYAGQLEVQGAEEWNENWQQMARHWYGRIDLDGNLTRGRGWTKVEATIKALTEDPAGTIAAYGKLTSRCSICGLPLSTPESLAVGYGPVCAKHYHLPWGVEKFDVTTVAA